MNKNIIIAGGGHGGIVAGAFLARNGFNVTVYEKNNRENMGYDWTDIFAPNALSAIGIPMPDESLYEYKTDMTFYSTNEKKAIRQRVPEDELEIKMERRDIYNHIISFAENCGVKFVYSCDIEKPISKNGRVIGIKTDKGDFYGDLIIDACGCNSPVRTNLNRGLGIQNQMGPFERFYVYRAFYNKTTEKAVEDKYKVCLFPDDVLGIGWVATEEEYTDLLIGRFEPFTLKEAEDSAEKFRQRNESLGKEILRGGQFVQIPVRHTLSVMVADGYAAIGDSAFMTVPIIGSGIANSFKAAKILADAVIDDISGEYTAKSLWKYQYNYYKALGSGLSQLATVKLLLTRLTPNELDYIFENDILTWREMTITANSTSLKSFIHISSDMPKRGVAIVKDKALLKKLLGVGEDIAKVVAVCLSMPKAYDKEKVYKWAKKYDNIFKV